MRALDAMMSLLPRRRSSVGRHEVARYTMTDFFNWQSQSMGYGGHQYGLGGSYGLNTTYGNRPVEAIGNSFEGYAGGLLFCDGPVASAEAYRLRVFGQAPMLFQKRVAGRPGDYYDDDSLNLFRRPWMGGTCSDLMKRALIHGDLGGQAYIVEIDGELVLLRPDWVEIVLAKRMYEGYQVGWTQVGIAYYEGGVGVTSDPALFVAGEYIHFVPGMPDPLATYRGMSWLTPVIREIQADKGASDHKVKWFENAATPNLAVSLPKEVTPTQFNEFVEQMDAKHKGAANAYKTLYTGGGADVTVIGANMQQMDFSNVEGKGETRIANAAGVPSTLLGFSEGMQGSSLNAGNYGPTKRNFVDTTGRDLWQNWCGSAEVLFPPPKDGDRLWYDPRDIPFLHEDQTDVATIKQIEASTMVSLVTAGFEKDSIIAATVAGDWSLLVDSGLVSVQLLPPGTTANDTAAPTEQARAAIERKFNPDQPRIPGGHDGGGRWGTVGALKGTILSAVQGLETRPRAPVRIVDLRAHLADVPRADLDRTLKEMDLDGAVQLEPDPVRSKLTPEDKRDAISLGGEDMHLVVRMSDPAGESGPKAPAAKRSREVVRRGFDPDQPRIDAGLEGGGRWGAVGRFMNRLAVHHGPGEIVPLSGKVNGEHGQVRVAHVIDITRGEHYIIVGSGTAAQLSGWHHTADYDGRTALFSSPDELASGLRRVIDDAEAGRTTGPYRIDGADLGDVDLEAAQTPEGPRVRLTTADYESQAIYETDPPPATFEDEDGNPRPLTDEERADWVAEQEAEATAANAASAAGYALLTPDQARQVLASLHLGPPPVTARSVMRKFNPDQPRIPGGHEGGGRWGSGEGLIQKLVHALTGQDALDAAPATYTSGPNAHFGNYEGATFDAPSGAGDPQALAEYEGLEYQQTNLFLRGQYRNDPVTGLPPTGEEDFLQGVNGRIAEIDKTMRVSGLTADVEVSRAIKDGKSVFGPAWTEGVMNAATTDFDEQDREYERWKAGERPDVTGLSWTERGYLSTSASDDHSKAFGERWARMAREMPGFEGEPVIMTIRVPAGTGAVQLGNLGFTEGPHGRQIMGSAELLMQRGLTMTVTADHGVDADGFRRLDVEVTRVRT